MGQRLPKGGQAAVQAHSRQPQVGHRGRGRQARRHRAADAGVAAHVERAQRPRRRKSARRLQAPTQGVARQIHLPHGRASGGDSGGQGPDVASQAVGRQVDALHAWRRRQQGRNGPGGVARQAQAAQAQLQQGAVAPAPAAAAAVAPAPAVNPSPRICVVCNIREANTRLNCGHLLCSICTETLTTCPLCRAPITSFLIGGYRQKYLKYKAKYLELKNSL